MNSTKPDVKKLRKAMNLTVIEMAERIGVNKATISRWENELPKGGAARALILALWEEHKHKLDKSG